MIVKPAPGVKVRHPFTREHLPAEGLEVPTDTFWLRRLRAGDVIEVVPVAAPVVVVNQQIPDSEG